MPIFGAKSRAMRGCASKLACGHRIGPAECSVFTGIFSEFAASQWADVGIGPYGKPNQPPKPAGAQRSVRARSREGWAGIGAKTIPKREGPPRDRLGSA